MRDIRAETLMGRGVFTRAFRWVDGYTGGGVWGKERMILVWGRFTWSKDKEDESFSLYRRKK